MIEYATADRAIESVASVQESVDPAFDLPSQLKGFWRKYSSQKKGEL